NWTDYGKHVARAARSLMALGFKTGNNVAILGFNRPEWVIFDVAAMAAGGAAAGIYTTCSPKEVAYIVSHSEAGIVLLEDSHQLEKVLAKLDTLKGLKHIVMMRNARPAQHPLVMSWDEFMAKGDDIPPAKLDERMASLKEDAVATLIYTSGTTGPPKAVMLTNHNLTWIADTAAAIISAVPTDCCLSYLPLSHIAEQLFSIHAAISMGYEVYYAESIEKVADNLKEVQPTIVFGVPRIWEKIHAKVSGQMAQATGVKKRIVNFAQRTGRQMSDVKMCGDSPGRLLRVKYRLANKLVFAKLKPLIGLSRTRFCISGAAPIAREVLEFFASLDIIVQEVYGQSEDCGPATFNHPGQTRLGTVGTPLEGTEVKIAPDGEILVKGPHVFAGYFKEEEATSAALIKGWLHTGDLGRFDQDGFLTIIGRKKEIIITAGGKNIAPKNIEAAIKNCPIVANAVVIGDRRKYLSALVTLDAEALGISEDQFASATSDQANIDTIDDWINAKVNPIFARVEQVRKFTVLDRPLSIDNGELTPTLKIKRRVVDVNFKDQIEAMYS
ncbi:MAG: AMP-binding protein, partial [Proteobacteria bacterium]|nr:AMP-binding protein [Pseudomonadota bacterium]